ncbi:hypothetical protein B0E53_06628 [Micromonospora sp. MH33]|nr:hypothetical protein B0E53_06628 [Micromonospora sp. MH33]
MRMAAATASASARSTASQNWRSAGSSTVATGPVRTGVSGQYRRRWKAYVGSGTAGPEPTPHTAFQSTPTPRTCSSARAVSIRGQPPASRRRVFTTAASCSPASMVSCIPKLSTGWGPTSRNTWWPSASRLRTACSKFTVSRRLRYQ